MLKAAQESGVNRIRLETIVPCKSVVWEERYLDAGNMQAVFAKTDTVMDAVRVGKFALIDGTLRLMYIYGIKLTETELWAYGYEAKALLQKNAMMNNGTNDGEVDIATKLADAMTLYGQLSYITTWIFPTGTLGTANLDGLEYNSVYDYIRKCLSLNGHGWNAAYMQSSGAVMLTADTGIDQSDYYLFASELGNVSGLSYALDNQSYYSRVYAVGEDNGSTVYVYEDEDNPEHEVYSVYLDCRLDFPRPDDMTRADYEDALHTRARMSLIARHAKETLTVKNIDTSGYGSLYFLGDIVTVAVPDYDVKQKMRIVCARRTIEGGVEQLALELTKVS